MSIPPGDLIVLGTVAFAALVGMIWLSRRINAESTADEMPTLRIPRLPRARRGANDNNDEAPLSGIRLKIGARAPVHSVDSRR